VFLGPAESGGLAEGGDMRPTAAPTHRSRARSFVRVAVSTAVIATAVALGLGPLAAGPERPSTVLRGQASVARPNIVLILTDDQRWDELDHMPNVNSLLVDHGVRFTNGFVVNSLCCPSRTTILTGQYSHTTGVYKTQGSYGGYAAFQDGSTVATWLDDAGYQTGLFGKYLNGYRDTTRIPPGWDRWFAFWQNDRHDYYYDYQANDQGTVRWFGTDREDYSTNVLANRAVRFIRSAAGPLFLYLAPYAPHGPATPAPVDLSAFPDMGPARPPSYDEADVSDKPAWVRALPRMDAEKRAKTDLLHVDQFRSLLAVDRMVGRVVKVLAETGRLQDTMIVFASDNGLSLGEHRWAGRKEAAYEESIRVPFVVRYDPMVSAPRVDGHLVLNLDLAPTFADLAGVADPGVEGMSLLPLLASSQTPWRSDFLVEHLAPAGDSNSPTTFCAVRTTRSVYVEYEGGEEELYDLRADPWELDNAASDPALASTLAALRTRARELCDPPPPGMTLMH
jgi:arylsulfatase A-like enzyme